MGLSSSLNIHPSLTFPCADYKGVTEVMGSPICFSILLEYRQDSASLEFLESLFRSPDFVSLAGPEFLLQPPDSISLAGLESLPLLRDSSFFPPPGVFQRQELRLQNL